MEGVLKRMTFHERHKKVVETEVIFLHGVHCISELSESSYPKEINSVHKLILISLLILSFGVRLISMSL